MGNALEKFEKEIIKSKVNASKRNRYFKKFCVDIFQNSKYYHEHPDKCVYSSELKFVDFSNKHRYYIETSRHFYSYVFRFTIDDLLIITHTEAQKLMNKEAPGITTVIVTNANRIYGAEHLSGIKIYSRTHFYNNGIKHLFDIENKQKIVPRKKSNVELFLAIVLIIVLGILFFFNIHNGCKNFRAASC